MTAMNSDASTERLRAVLDRMGAPHDLAAPLLERLGPTAADQLVTDPWRLLRLPRVTVEQADHAARGLLGGEASPDDPRRGRALVVHLLARAARSGHTALDHDRLSGALRRMGVRSPGAALAAARDDGDVLEFTVDPDPDGDPADPEAAEPAELGAAEHSYALPALGRAEQELGAGLDRLLATTEPIMDPTTAAETVDEAARRHGFDLTAPVAAACVTAALRGVCVVDHEAGTAGAVAQVVAGAAAIAAASGITVAVTTPTVAGAVALRRALAPVAEGAVEVVPLGRLLEAGEAGGFTRGPGQPLAAELVLVVGAMALDVERAAALVSACADGTHLVFVADAREAPSAAPGQVVADLVASRMVPVAPLPGPAEPGPLARLAAAVAAGELGPVPAPEREVVIVPAASGEDVTHRVRQLVTDSIPRVLGIPAGGTVVVTAARGGPCGSVELNAVCKEWLNPGPGAFGGFDAGDRVLLAGSVAGCVAGDTGVVREIAGDGAVVELDDGHRAVVGDLGRLRHGWALPVSAAHGAHWPAVVAVVGPDAPVSRPHVYTALTRARQHLSVVHAAGPEAARVVREVARVERHTRLAQVLREG